MRRRRSTAWGTSTARRHMGRTPPPTAWRSGGTRDREASPPRPATAASASRPAPRTSSRTRAPPPPSTRCLAALASCSSRRTSPLHRQAGAAAVGDPVASCAGRRSTLLTRLFSHPMRFVPQSHSVSFPNLNVPARYMFRHDKGCEPTEPYSSIVNEIC